MLIEATVKDAAGHAETRGEPITVSESPLIVTAIPEGGTLIPNLENQVFILTSYADGKPAIADVRVHPDGTIDQNVTTDAGGVAVIHVTGSAAARTLGYRSRRQGGKSSVGPSAVATARRARTRFCCAPSAPFIAPAIASS